MEAKQINITVFRYKAERNNTKLPFENGDWRKLASHFINLISLMGLDIPGPLRNFRNEGLRNSN